MKTNLHGGRMPRLIDQSGEAWYHIHNRIACESDRMILAEHSEAQTTLIRFIDFYTKAYSCEVATYIVMGNHYHLIVKMVPYQDLPREELEKRVQSEAQTTLVRFIDFYTKAYSCEVATYIVMGNHYHLIVKMVPYQDLPREELEKRVQDFYPNTHEQTQYWLEEHWQRFNQRLFSLADLMRNIQQGFARWFNKTTGRRGRFWADRFKSTLLYGEKSVLECMQYVDLNAVRAGLVERPEDYAFGALRQRHLGNGSNLLDLKVLLNENNSYQEYRSLLYLRGGMPSKENQAVIPETLIDQELAKNFKLGRPKDGEGREHFRFYVDGLVIGAKNKVEQWLAKLKNSGHYRRKKHVKSLTSNDLLFCMREQRGY